MSRANIGLKIAGDSRSMRNETIYDSQRSKLTVDPDATPAHFDLLEPFGGGTKWSVADTDVRLYEEVLLQIKHNLPFKPMFLAYFYPVTTPVGGTAASRQYSVNKQLMLFNAISLGQEEIYADADETYFYIKHQAQRFNFGGPNPYVFYGSDYQFRIRYFIFNQPSFLIDGGIEPSS
jgi:hypothetical protein